MQMPRVPETFAAARWFTSYYYIQFDANRTVSYRKVNFCVETMALEGKTKAKLGLNSLFMSYP